MLYLLQNLEIENKLSIHRKTLSAICAKARNQYSTQQIRKDFRAGLRVRAPYLSLGSLNDSLKCFPVQVMKRQAGLTNPEEDVEEEDEFEDDDDDEDLAHAVQNLNVFCVSSTEYLKLCHKLPKDGPPAVSLNVYQNFS